MRGAIHTVGLLDPGEMSRDKEGNWTATGEPRVVPECRVASRGIPKWPAGAQQGDKIYATVVMPLGTVITDSNLVRVDGVSAFLDGTYLIDEIRPNPSQIRVLVSRFKRPEVSN